MSKQPRLGSGERFKKLANSIARKGNVENPGAVASSIGMKKYGKNKMEKTAQVGKKRHQREDE